MQSCLGSSLSKSFFGNRFDSEAGKDDDDLLEESDNDDDDIESAFSTSKFSSSLFSISQNSAADDEMHRAHCDKSMKFGRHRHLAMLKKMRVGPILKIVPIPYF